MANIAQSFGEWKYTVDQAATRKAYSQILNGGAETCSCSACQNFVEVRNKVFPSEFIRQLEALGIDSKKDFEVYQEGAEKAGSHFYGGWYHFIGTLDKDGDFPPVEYPGGFISFMRKKLLHVFQL